MLGIFIKLFYLFFSKKISIFAAKQNLKLKKMDQNNYYSWLKNKEIVGGIFYQPVSKPEQHIDIYGNPISLSDLLISTHLPIWTGMIPSVGYQSRYQFTPSQDDEQDAQDNSSKPITYSNPIVNTLSPTLTIKKSFVESQSDKKDLIDEPDFNNTKIVHRLKGKSEFKILEQMYKSELKKRGINSRYAKWLASKDALETGWGKTGHGAEHLNYGNVIAGSNWKGDSYVGGDHDKNGKKIQQRFRAYSSLNDYVSDVMNLLTTAKRYKNIFVGDVDGFADRLSEAGYAEDPNYSNKIKNVYNSW